MTTRHKTIVWYSVAAMLATSVLVCAIWGALVTLSPRKRVSFDSRQPQYAAAIAWLRESKPAATERFQNGSVRLPLDSRFAGLTPSSSVLARTASDGSLLAVAFPTSMGRGINMSAFVYASSPVPPSVFRRNPAGQQFIDIGPRAMYLDRTIGDGWYEASNWDD
jgi:hypothetical protein